MIIFRLVQADAHRITFFVQNNGNKRRSYFYKKVYLTYFEKIVKFTHTIDRIILGCFKFIIVNKVLYKWKELLLLLINYKSIKRVLIILFNTTK